MSVAKQIIGSFEDIGKQVATESVKVPADIAGKALESLGTPTQNPQSPQIPKQAPPEKKPLPPRAWLEELAGKTKKQKEPPVRVRLEQEEAQKREALKRQMPEMPPLPKMTYRQKPGDLYGVKQRQAAVEKKGFRQD